MHIEQARVLQDTGNRIVLVTAIAGYMHADVVVMAGATTPEATPMDLRLDPTLPMAETIVELERLAPRGRRGNRRHGRRDRGRPRDHQRRSPLQLRFSLDIRGPIDDLYRGVAPRHRRLHRGGRPPPWIEGQVPRAASVPTRGREMTDFGGLRGCCEGDRRAVHAHALGRGARRDLHRRAGCRTRWSSSLARTESATTPTRTPSPPTRRSPPRSS